MSEPAHMQRVRTFKPRRRQLSPARAALMQRLEPSLCLDVDGPPLDLAAVFGRDAPVIFDIGIGFGDSVTTAASAEPEFDVIGADVHTPGIASTLAAIDELSLTNVRLVHGDALQFADRLAMASLAGIRIYFPDPWHKARHRNRRLASDVNIARFVDLLEPNGWLHVATDIDNYAEQVQRLCEDHPLLTSGVIARPEARPLTRYERKGEAAGRTPTDLMYHRMS